MLRITTRNIEWLLSLWQRLRGNRLARNAGYLVFAAAALFSNFFQLVAASVAYLLGLHISVPDTPWWAPAMLLGFATVLLVVDRALPDKISITEHDRDLFAKYQSLVTQDIRDFLDEHSFGQSWFRARLDGLTEFSYWKGERFQFNDPQLNAELTESLRLTNAFEDLLSAYSYPHSVLVGWQTAYTQVDEQRGPQPRTLENIRSLNEAAKSLVASIDRLDRVGRQKTAVDRAKSV